MARTYSYDDGAATHIDKNGEVETSAHLYIADHEAWLYVPKKNGGKTITERDVAPTALFQDF